MFSPSSGINPCHSLFIDRDHLRFNMAIISDPGSFAVQFGDQLRSGIICGPGSFAVLGSFADPYISLTISTRMLFKERAINNLRPRPILSTIGIFFFITVLLKSSRLQYLLYDVSPVLCSPRLL